MQRLAYILAASHSGSTLLAMLLGAQSGACSVGELKATSLGDADFYRCSCRERIRDCGFWKQVSVAMNSHGFSGFEITAAQTSFCETQAPFAGRLLAPLYRGATLEWLRDMALLASPEWRARRFNIKARNLALIQSLAEVTRSRLIIDSSKVALRLKYLLRIPELEVRVIRMIRDGRAVSLAYTDEWNYADSIDPAMRDGGTGNQSCRKPRPMSDAAREWKRSNESADLLCSHLPDEQWTEVRYEELCADPEGTIKRLATFLDLDPEHVTLDFRSREHHVIGNGMRLDGSSDIRLDNRWESELSEYELRVFDKVAGQLNRSYGYA